MKTGQRLLFLLIVATLPLTPTTVSPRADAAFDSIHTFDQRLSHLAQQSNSTLKVHELITFLDEILSALFVTHSEKKRLFSSAYTLLQTSSIKHQPHSSYKKLLKATLQNAGKRGIIRMSALAFLKHYKYRIASTAVMLAAALYGGPKLYRYLQNNGTRSPGGGGGNAGGNNIGGNNGGAINPHNTNPHEGGSSTEGSEHRQPGKYDIDEDEDDGDNSTNDNLDPATPPQPSPQPTTPMDSSPFQEPFTQPSPVLTPSLSGSPRRTRTFTSPTPDTQEHTDNNDIQSPSPVRPEKLPFTLDEQYEQFDLSTLFAYEKIKELGYANLNLNNENTLRKLITALNIPITIHDNSRLSATALQELISLVKRKVETCPICLSNIFSKKASYIKGCRHCFHTQCIKTWFKEKKRKKKCPNCNRTKNLKLINLPTIIIRDLSITPAI